MNLTDWSGMMDGWGDGGENGGRERVNGRKGREKGGKIWWKWE